MSPKHFSGLKLANFLGTLLLIATPAYAADLQVTVKNVQAGKGELFVVLFDRAQDFPSDPASNAPLQRLKPQSETVQVQFTNLPEGRWAVAVLQDLNGNTKQDFNALGFPKEPYGVSGNKLPRLSAPKFEEASFQLADKGLAISIELRRPD